MQANSDILKEIENIIHQKDTRYKMQGYLFVMGGLDYTIKKIGNRRHVTGQELSTGIKDFALEQFGPTAQMVFEHWGITVTRDFGNIVYNLIESGLMNKTATDQVEDFNEVFDFKSVFPKTVRIIASKVNNSEESN